MMNDPGPEPTRDVPAVEEPGPGGPEADKPEHFEGKRERKSRRWLLGLAVLMLLGAALARGVWWHYGQYREAVTTAEERRNFVPSLRVGIVTMSGNMLNVMQPCTTLAYEAANIFARATGYISTRNVDIGSKVRAGDVLAIISAPDLNQQLVQARAQLIQMQAAVEQAKATAELGRVTSARSSKLVTWDSVSRQQSDNDRLTYASETAALGVTEANVVAQQAAVDRLVYLTGFERVKAPFDGTVTARNIDVGSLVQADDVSGTFLFTMVHGNVMRVQAYVPQDQAFGLTPGNEAVIHVPEMPNRSFPGKVTRIADALEPATRTLLTEVDVPNPDGALTPGVYCTIDIRAPRKTPSFLVPADAIIFNQHGLRVAVVQDDTVHMQQITIARDLGRQLEVLTGVQYGDKVVLNPPADLKDGGKIHVRTAPAGANP
jgi:RND family efflux transporter MFP subunit